MHFNYLSDPHDLRELIEGVHKTRELVMQAAFDGLRGVELIPGPDIQSDADIAKWIRSVTVTDFHPSGSCRMGHDRNSVVNDHMKVHDVEQLRVVDASVLPRIISANLNAPIQLMAARAADFIAQVNPLEPEHAAFAF